MEREGGTEGERGREREREREREKEREREREERERERLKLKSAHKIIACKKVKPLADISNLFCMHDVKHLIHLFSPA